MWIGDDKYVQRFRDVADDNQSNFSGEPSASSLVIGTPSIVALKLPSKANALPAKCVFPACLFWCTPTCRCQLRGRGFEHSVQCRSVLPQKSCDEMKIAAFSIRYNAVGQCVNGKMLEILCVGAGKFAGESCQSKAASTRASSSTLSIVRSSRTRSISAMYASTFGVWASTSWCILLTIR